jgi:hypothetical protein
MNMPTASKSGTRDPGRRNWRNGDRPRSRPGPRSRSRPNPITELSWAVQALIRFHKTHSGWFPPPSSGVGSPKPAPISPEWEEAICKAYQAAPAGPGVPVAGSKT